MSQIDVAGMIAQEASFLAYSSDFKRPILYIQLGLDNLKSHDIYQKKECPALKQAIKAFANSIKLLDEEIIELNTNSQWLLDNKLKAIALLKEALLYISIAYIYNDEIPTKPPNKNHHTDDKLKQLK